MAKHDEILDKASKELKVLTVMEREDCPANNYFGNNTGDSSKHKSIEFRHCELRMKLFESSGRSNELVGIIGAWIDKTEWSKKVILNREHIVEWVPVAGTKMPRSVKTNVLKVDLWVEKVEHADELWAEMKRVHAELSAKPIDSYHQAMAINKLLAHAAVTDGWLCRCGYANNREVKLCIECLCSVEEGKVRDIRI